MRTLIIIPAYNEEGNVMGVVGEIKQFFPWFDLIVVNDESHDRTQALLEQNDVMHLNAPINLGIGGAVQLGYT